jgi:predicted SPOUT superfamily RNA methylase MTH1
MWLHKNKVINKIEDFPKETFGFIYKITNNETGKFYIGKKQLMSKTNVKLGKKEKAALPTQRGRTPSKKLVVKEADWQNYWGSNKPLLEELKSHKDKFTREILMVCSSKKMLTYWEAAYQIKLDVLLIDSYNETVLGHYYKKDFLS